MPGIVFSSRRQGVHKIPTNPQGVQQHERARSYANRDTAMSTRQRSDDDDDNRVQHIFVTSRPGSRCSYTYARCLVLVSWSRECVFRVCATVMVVVVVAWRCDNHVRLYIFQSGRSRQIIMGSLGYNKVRIILCLWHPFRHMTAQTSGRVRHGPWPGS